MTILVCGSRNTTEADYPRIRGVLSQYEPGARTHLIHGAAPGVDKMAHRAGQEFGFFISSYPADWKAYGRQAGPKRNQEMLDKGSPDIVIAFPRKASRGTWDMVKRARAQGIHVVLEPLEAL